MERRKEIALGICIILLIVLLGYFSNPVSILGKAIDSGKGSASGNAVQVQLTRENFNLFLQQQKVVSDLPKSAVISLRLYNFNSGERQWEKSYIITKGKVIEGNAENPDLDIILSSKYIYEIAKDMCAGVNLAKKNGDIGFDLKISEAGFLWKYKSMFGYRSCFGF